MFKLSSEAEDDSASAPSGAGAPGAGWADDWKVLVLDADTRAIVGPLLSVPDLRAHGVTLHVAIDAPRDLLPDVAPKHVERIKLLVGRGFYDGTPFHRVLEGFMAQGGDPTGTGTGGSKYPNVPAEFTNKRKFLRGTVGAARSQSPNSANSKFFIMFAPGSFLDGPYTIWGQVVAGMEIVDTIKRGEPVREPDRIIHARVAADVKN
jgi:peptidylprolyl isomerase